MESYLTISFLFIFFIGLFGLSRWEKGKINQHILISDLIWTGICLISYLTILEISLGTFYFIVPLSLLCVFLFSYFKEKRQLINGLFFNLFFVSSLLYLTFMTLQIRNFILVFFFIIEFFSLTLLFIAGFYILLIFLYWNASVVFRKEGHSVANLLTLFLAIGLTLFLVIAHFSTKISPLWAELLFQSILWIMFYFFIVFYDFLMISLIYQLNQPKYDQDFIIVLGAGLIDGKTVPPLLAKRIDKAIQFYFSQKQQHSSSPKLIMSGGKGDDETLAEGVAMKNYAIEKNIPEKDILIEDRSTNTLENMQFSKRIMEKEFGSGTFKAIFVTNNFHLFRSGLFAKEAQLKANGIGAKTAFYFLPNAFLREFVAIIFMKKKQHLIVCTSIFLFAGIIALLLFRTKLH